jgi:fused signal recognition particle receptor
MNIFSRLKDGLKKTRTQIASIISGGTKFDDAFFEALEDALIQADIGFETSIELIARLRTEIRDKSIDTSEAAYAALKKLLADDLTVAAPVVHTDQCKPWVILVVGVNGAGKTTTIGKLANEFRQTDKSVLLGAADTFRAGATEQLTIWAQRTGADIVSQQEGADPASVAFDAMEAAKSRGSDVLILDTAGRLHNKTNLIKRNSPTAPNEILLVVDATTGQNALNQAKVFHEITGLTGFVITKLDGTAKGGIAVAMTKRFGIPIRKIGVGEGMDDLQNFDPAAYVEAMFGDLSQNEKAGE